MDTGQDDTENADQSNDQAVVIDDFCWFCSKKGMEFNCCKCYRSFHCKCVDHVVKNIDMRNGQNIFMNHHNDNTGFTCPVCKVTQVWSKYQYMDKQTIARTLKCIMEKVFSNDKYKKLKHLNSSIMTNPMDLIGINQKIHSQLYNSLGSFLTDIIYIGYYNNIQDKNSSLITAVVELVRYCKSEFKNIIDCAECYENMHTTPNQWQILACNRPHLLLWIRLNRSLNFWAAKEGYNYWPAKMMSDGEQSVRIMLFKGTEFVEVPKSDCFAYSKKVPKSIMGTWSNGNPKNMEGALEDVSEYARNVEKKFGRFHISPESVPFNQRSWCTHVRTMLPDYTGPLKIIRWIGIRNESNASNKRSLGNETEESNDDKIPNKRQRLSEQINNDTKRNFNPVATSNISSFNQIRTQNRIPFDSNSNPEYKSKLHEELSQTTKHLEDLIKKIESTSPLAIQALHQELEDLKKSNADFQVKNNKLLGRLNAVTGERDQAIHEVAKLKEQHAKEIMALKKKHNEEADVAKMSIKKANDQFGKIQKQHKFELNAEKQRASIAIKQLKLEHTIDVAKLKKSMQNMEQSTQYLRNKVDNNNKLMLEFEKKLEKNHKNELIEIRDQHKIELEIEKKRASDEMEKLRQKVGIGEHSYDDVKTEF